MQVRRVGIGILMSHFFSAVRKCTDDHSIPFFVTNCITYVVQCDNQVISLFLRSHGNELCHKKESSELLVERIIFFADMTYTLGVCSVAVRIQENFPEIY